jgi:hypothetical protein
VKTARHAYNAQQTESSLPKGGAATANSTAKTAPCGLTATRMELFCLKGGSTSLRASTERTRPPVLNGLHHEYSLFDRAA